MCIIVYVLHVFQKKKAEGPAEPQQPAKKMKPPIEATPAVAMEIESCDPEALKQQIDAQGDKVRELKSSGAEKVISLPQHVTIAGASGLGYRLFQLQHTSHTHTHTCTAHIHYVTSFPRGLGMRLRTLTHVDTPGIWHWNSLHILFSS